MTTIDKDPKIAQFEAAKRKFETLLTRRQRAEVELATARRQYLEKSNEAKAEFGSDQIADLRQEYKTREERRNQDIFEFCMAVEELEAELNDIDAKAA